MKTFQLTEEQLNALKAGREHRTFTQASMARILNISEDAYQKYEVGKRRIPSDVLFQLTRCLNLDGFDAFFDESERVVGTSAKDLALHDVFLDAILSSLENQDNKFGEYCFLLHGIITRYIEACENTTLSPFFPMANVKLPYAEQFDIYIKEVFRTISRIGQESGNGYEGNYSSLFHEVLHSLCFLEQRNIIKSDEFTKILKYYEGYLQYDKDTRCKVLHHLTWRIHLAYQNTLHYYPWLKGKKEEAEHSSNRDESESPLMARIMRSSNKTEEEKETAK